MISWTYSLIIILMLGCLPIQKSSHISTEKSQKKFLDKWIIQLINNIDGQIEHTKSLSIFTLPPFETVYFDTISSYMNVNVIVHYQPGVVSGFGFIHQIGATDVVTDITKGEITIKMDLEWNDGIFEQSGRLKYGNLHEIPIKSRGTFNNLVVCITIHINDQHRAQLINFNVTRSGTLNFDTFGIRYHNSIPYHEFLHSDYTNRTRSALRNILLSSIKDVVNQTVSSTLYIDQNMPVVK